MKRIAVVMFLLIAIIAMSVAIDCNLARAQAPFLTTEQVMNKVLDTSEGKLKVKADLDVGTLSVAIGAFNNTVMKKVIISPNTDSGAALSFGTAVSKWTFLNLADTAEVYIKFEAAAGENDFKVPAGLGVAGDSKVTTIHAFAKDTAEIEVIGLY